MTAKRNDKKPSRRRSVVAVVGYGSQGRAVALNLRDSGYPVVVGLPAGSKSRARARREGMQDIHRVADAVAAAGIVCFAFPDHLHGRVYRTDIAPNLRSGASLWFLHGLSVHFGLVRPAEDGDVFLVAPHGPGVAVRREYEGERSISGFFAVERDASGHAAGTALAMARGIGIGRRNLIETTFEQEAVGDLFGEQAVLCGGLAALIKSGFETLVTNGLKAENAYLEVAYQLDLIVDLIKKYGIEGMFARISVAARYGSVLAGPKIIDASAKKRMQKIYEEINSGRFARRLERLSDKEIADLDQAVRSLTNPRLEKAARKFAR